MRGLDPAEHDKMREPTDGVSAPHILGVAKEREAPGRFDYVTHTLAHLR
jgi:hypothetical protein